MWIPCVLFLVIESHNELNDWNHATIFDRSDLGKFVVFHILYW